MKLKKFLDAKFHKEIISHEKHLMVGDIVKLMNIKCQAVISTSGRQISQLFHTRNIQVSTDEESYSNQRSFIPMKFVELTKITTPAIIFE